MFLTTAVTFEKVKNKLLKVQFLKSDEESLTMQSTQKSPQKSSGSPSTGILSNILLSLLKILTT